MTALWRTAWLVGLLTCGESTRGPARNPGASASTDAAATADGAAEPGDAAAARSAEGPLAPASASGEPNQVAAPVVTRSGETADDRVGHLEGTGSLAHVFEALAALEAGQARDDVRLVQYGDSHTASDSGTAVTRRLLQARFGDGGRGFVSIGLPWRNYVQNGVRGGMSKEFEPERARRLAHPEDPRSPGDGHFGLLGVSVASDRPGAHAWTQLAAASSRVEVAYLERPAGGSFEMLVDGARVGRVTTGAARVGSGYFAAEVPEGPHQVDVVAEGDGPVRIFGLSLDRSRVGVVLDAVGINGAQVYTPLLWDETHFVEQLAHRAPALVVLAYGTNEALEPSLDLADYERALHTLIERVGRAAPSASCLLLGPPDLARPASLVGRVASTGEPPTSGEHDAKGAPVARGGWSSWPPLHDVIAVQRRVARSAGCAFYDQQGAMGGPGAMVAWASDADPKGQRDRVHFTASGYAALATAFTTDFLAAYAARRRVVASPP